MVSIRGYRGSDLAACRRLWVELTLHHRQIYRVDTIGGDDPGSQFDDHLVAVGRERIWVAEDAARIVGLSGLIVDGTSGEIEPVVVSEEMRRHGIGRALVERVIHEADAIGITLLSVRPVGRNTAALKFFRDAGFDILGHIEAIIDLTGDREWVAGEQIAGREFRV